MSCCDFVDSIVCFFCFKQKTAYEMLISDLSSDVCSSDLSSRRGCGKRERSRPMPAPAPRSPSPRMSRRCSPMPSARPDLRSRISAAADALTKSLHRSEEHTSELQSLLRISYAVFCLKKKKSTHTYQTQAHHKPHHS